VKNESKNTLFYGLMMQKLIMKTKKSSGAMKGRNQSAFISTVFYPLAK
jgi:hypothetical protein